MDQDSDIHLRWNNHQTTLLSVFSSLLSNENLADCTISAEGRHFKAHRVILSACSPYFESLFNMHCEKNTIVILPEVKFKILKALVEFMYTGEVKVPQDKLSTVLELAETLQIKGLSATGESSMKDGLGRKRRNHSAIFSDQQSFKKHLCESRYGFQVKRKEDVSSLHASEKEFSEDTDSLLLFAQKCDKNSSTSVSHEKTIELPHMFQDSTDSEAFSVFQCSSLTKTPNILNTCLSGISLNSVPNTLDSSQLPGCSKETIGEQNTLSENVLPMCSSSVELRTSEPLGVNGDSPAVDLTEIKQEDPEDSKGNSVEEIILDDDDTDVNDDHNDGSGGDKCSTFGGRMIREESFSAQGVTLEQYRDTYFVEPASLLPNQFKCDACGRSYRYKRGLWRHLKFECGKEPQFSCPQCQRRFFHKHDLKMHIFWVHSAHLV